MQFWMCCKKYGHKKAPERPDQFITEMVNQVLFILNLIILQVAAS